MFNLLSMRKKRRLIPSSVERALNICTFIRGEISVSFTFISPRRDYPVKADNNKRINPTFLLDLYTQSRYNLY